LNPSQIAEKKAVVLKEFYKRNPVAWLRDCVKTVDEHDRENPIKKFPIKPYVPPLTELFYKEPILMVPKSRQVMASWLFTALCTHEAEFFGYRRTIFISKKQEDANALVDRAKFVYLNQPKWLRVLCPLDRKERDLPMGKIFWFNGSNIAGFPQGEDQVRSYTPSRVFLDEMAIMDEAEQTYTAAIPAITGGGHLVGCSSAKAGFMQRLCEC
jgi:hypothetical protein